MTARCGQPTATGRACRRTAGAGTQHPGEGPCDRHEHVPLADNQAAQQAFLEAVRAQPNVGIRTLIGQLGYRKRDVTDLIARDEEFAEAYAAARGRDLDRVEQTLWQVAQDIEHPSWQRANRFLLEARGEAAFRDVKYHRVDGTVDVRAVPYIDFDRIGPEKTARVRELLTELRELAAEGAPDPAELPKDGRAALELLPPAVVDDAG